jgi:DNA-binding transcriptional LysR family regulator
MDLQDLHLFLRVCDLGSLSSAAREADLAVSQVSRALARLEAQEGVQLLHRSTHSLSLTSAGHTLKSHGQRMLDELHNARLAFNEGRESLRGSVRVGASPAMANFILAPSLAALGVKHPEIRVALVVSDRMSDMAKDALDVTVRTGSFSGDNLIARRIGTQGRILVASAAYIERYGSPKTPAELNAHRLITTSEVPSFNHWPFNDPAKPCEVTLYRAVGHLGANSSATTIALALAGAGIARVNSTICAPHLAQGELVEVLADFTHDEAVPVFAVMLPERQRNPLVRALVDHWVEHFGKLGA